MFGIFSVEIKYLWGAIYGLCCTGMNPILLIHLLYAIQKQANGFHLCVITAMVGHDLTNIYLTTAFYWNEHRPQNVNTMPVSHTILRNKNPHYKVKMVWRIKYLLKPESDKVIGQCRSGNLLGMFGNIAIRITGSTLCYIAIPHRRL